MNRKTLAVQYEKYVAVPYGRGCGGYSPFIDFYVTYTKDNGEKLYILNGEVVSKEEGNKHYVEVKEYCKRNKHEAVFRDYSESKEEKKMTDEEYADELREDIDIYTNYIDDYGQQKAAEKANDKIYALINAVLN